MVDNRISLRLDDNEIRAIEGFLAAHTEYGSRSHLAREAIRTFIEEGKGWSETDASDEAAGRLRTYVITLAPVEADVLERMVETGYYIDMGDAIRRIVGKSVVDGHLEETLGSIHESRRKLVQMDRDK